MNAPEDDHDYSLARNGFGWLFWAALAFCGLCAVAGLAVSRLGPQWFPTNPAHAAARPPPHHP